MVNIKSFLTIGLVLCGLALVSCPGISEGPDGSPQKPNGSLTITITDGVSRAALLPGIDMSPASYRLTGTGPGTASLDQIFMESSKTFEALVSGTWTITITARNNQGTDIGEGTGSITVYGNAPASLVLTVRPFTGNGTLSLNLEWNAALIISPAVQTELINADDVSQTLTFTLGAGGASYSGSAIPAGYYTLNIDLYDGAVKVSGGTTVVRIVAGNTTSGTIQFTLAPPETGGGNQIHFIILQEMNDALDIGIIGRQGIKNPDQSLTFNGKAFNYQGTVSWKWYVNGSSKGNNVSYIFDDTWPEGYYTITLTGFTADGKRAGCSSLEILVSDDVSISLDGIIADPGIPGAYIQESIYGFIFSGGSSGSVTLPSLTNVLITVSVPLPGVLVDWAAISILGGFGTTFSNFSTEPLTFSTSNSNRYLIVRVIDQYETASYYAIAVSQGG
jgi:hypothetical protein